MVSASGGLLPSLRHVCYSTIWGMVKYLPVPLGCVMRTAVLKLFGCRTRSWRIRDGVTIWYPERLRIGAHCTINQFALVDAAGGVDIGSYVRVAQAASIVSEDHGTARVDVPIAQQPRLRQRVTIEDDVWIGAGASILRGVSIGQGPVIGAGAVVTSDVPPWAVVVGVPARVVRYREGTA